MKEHARVPESLADRFSSDTARKNRVSPGLENNRVQATIQVALAEMANASHRVVHQRAVADAINSSPRQAANALNTPRRETGNTGLPDLLKSGIEAMSGMSMDHVKVHYNSSKPAQLNAHAYAQRNDIHVAPGQERHLPHEAWHVVQQRQGRVRSTLQMASVMVNDDVGLEREADLMGARAVSQGAGAESVRVRAAIADQGGTVSSAGKVAQRAINLSAYTLQKSEDEQEDENAMQTGDDEQEYVGVTTNEKRPAGAGGHQGDHTTPFVTLQSQIANAIRDLSIGDAWENLASTFGIYKNLPGWEKSKKFIRVDLANHIDGLLSGKGNIDAMQEAVNEMLRLRNQMEYTSIPKGGHGNGESKWAGSLQHQERQFQLGHMPALQKNDVLDYMWKAFDHIRVLKQGKKNRDNIYIQHAMTMADAYPQLSDAYGIVWKDVLSHLSTQEHWVSYKPAN